MDRLTVARHRYTVGKSFGSALLFAAFDLSTLVMGHKPFRGHLPACKLALVSLLRRCRSAVKCSRLSDRCLVFYEVLSTVAYLHGPPGFCTKSWLSVCQSSWALWQALTTASSRAEPPPFTHSPRGAFKQYSTAPLSPVRFQRLAQGHLNRIFLFTLPECPSLWVKGAPGWKAIICDCVGDSALRK